MNYLPMLMLPEIHLLPIKVVHTAIIRITKDIRPLPQVLRRIAKGIRRHLSVMHRIRRDIRPLRLATIKRYSGNAM